MVWGLLHASCSSKKLEVGCCSLIKELLDDPKQETLGTIAYMSAFAHGDASSGLSLNQGLLPLAHSHFDEMPSGAATEPLRQPSGVRIGNRHG